MRVRSRNSRGGDWSGLSSAMYHRCRELSWANISSDEKERLFIVAEAQERAELELARLKRRE